MFLVDGLKLVYEQIYRLHFLENLIHLYDKRNNHASPHSASKTKESIVRTSVRAVENILEFFASG